MPVVSGLDQFDGQVMVVWDISIQGPVDSDQQYHSHVIGLETEYEDAVRFAVNDVIAMLTRADRELGDGKMKLLPEDFILVSLSVVTVLNGIGFDAFQHMKRSVERPMDE